MLKSIGERTTYHKKNRKCPKCKKPMGWTEGLLSMTGIPDYALGRYACVDCGIIPAAEESRAIRKGRCLAKKDGGVLNALDKQLTELPTYIQIGYLRQKQEIRGD